MKHAVTTWLCVFAGLVLYWPSTSEAAPLRFALLTDPVALSDTVGLLRDAGCTRQALASFESLASNRTSRLSINLSDFPTARKGFYDFVSLEALVDAMSTNVLCEGTTFDFNCIDTVFLLAGAKLQTTLKPDDLSGPFLVYKLSTNVGPSNPWVVPAATPRDAFAQTYEAYYQKSAEQFPRGLRDARICLTAALFGLYVLPLSASTNCSDAVLPVLQASWRRNGVRFPSNFEVLLHRAEGLTLRTSHAGLVFPRGDSFTYIEKIGGMGNFVRLDVADKADILKWLGSMNLGTNINERLFVTLNENVSELVPALPPKKANAAKPTRN